MGKESNSSNIEVTDTKRQTNPAIWITLLAVVAFPLSLISAIPLALAARKGFSRANLVYLTALSGVLTTVVALMAPDPVTGYKDAVLGIINFTDITQLDAPNPNYALFILAGLTVGCLLATIYAFFWRSGHKNDEEWLETHVERSDALSQLFSKGRNAKIAASNEVVIERISEGDWFGSEEVGLGYILDSVERGHKIEPVGLPDLVGGSVNHSLILGSSGRGKTQTITRQAFDAIKKGDPVLVVDAKGDGDLAAKLGAYAEEFGRPFYHFSIPSSTSAPYVGASERGRAFYDPAGLSAGNHTRRRDFMMNARDWKGAPAVYSDKTRDWLSRALWVDNVVAEVNGGRPLDTAPKATFARVADLMSPVTTRHYLREAANRFGSDALDTAFGTTTYAAMMAELEQYATVTDQTGESARMSHAAWLRTFMTSIVGPYLLDTGDDRTVDIGRIVEEQAVCIFDLATDQYREEAPALARLVVADLLSYISSSGKFDGLRLRVFLDEFAAVGGDESANVLARARSAGVSFTLSTQTLSDLRDVSEAFEGQVLTNCLNLLVHNASTWDEAQRLAGMTGQVEQQKVTKSQRIDGIDGARTKSTFTEKRYRVEPDEFMEMGVGELVKISQVERGSGKAVKVGVVMPPRVEGSMYTVEGYAPASKLFFDESDTHLASADEPDVDSNSVIEPEVESLDTEESQLASIAPAGDEEFISGGLDKFTSGSLPSDEPTLTSESEEVEGVESLRETDAERRARILATVDKSTSLFEPEVSVTPTTEPSADLEPSLVRPTRTVRRPVE